MIIHNLKRLVLLSSLLFSSLSIVSCGSSSSSSPRREHRLSWRLYKYVPKNKYITAIKDEYDFAFMVSCNYVDNGDYSYTIEGEIEFFNYTTDIDTLHSLLLEEHIFGIGKALYGNHFVYDYDNPLIFTETANLEELTLSFSLKWYDVHFELFLDYYYIFFSLIESEATENFNNKFYYYFSIKDYSVDKGEAS